MGGPWRARVRSSSRGSEWQCHPIPPPHLHLLDLERRVPQVRVRLVHDLVGPRVLLPVEQVPRGERHRQQHAAADQTQKHDRRHAPVLRKHPLRQRHAHVHALGPVRVAVLLVVLARDRVGEGLVGLGDVRGKVGRRGRVGVFVRVVLQRQLSVRLFDVAVRRAAVDAEDGEGVKGGEVARVARGEDQQGDPGGPGDDEQQGLAVAEGAQEAREEGRDAGAAGAAAGALFVLFCV